MQSEAWVSWTLPFRKDKPHAHTRSEHLGSTHVRTFTMIMLPATLQRCVFASCTSVAFNHVSFKTLVRWLKRKHIFRQHCGIMWYQELLGTVWRRINFIQLLTVLDLCDSCDSCDSCIFWLPDLCILHWDGETTLDVPQGALRKLVTLLDGFFETRNRMKWNQKYNMNQLVHNRIAIDCKLLHCIALYIALYIILYIYIYIYILQYIIAIAKSSSKLLSVSHDWGTTDLSGKVHQTSRLLRQGSCDHELRAKIMERVILS